MNSEDIDKNKDGKMKDKQFVTFFMFIVIVVGLFFTIKQYEFPAVAFVPHKTSDIVDLLMMLFIVSFLCERTIEFFMTVAYAEKSEALEREIVADKKKGKDCEKKEADLVAHKNRSRFTALSFSFIVGVVVSLSGVRVLEYFFNLEAIECTLRATVFRCIDVVFTGGVLAGGNEALHKCIKVVTDMSEAASAEAKEKKSKALLGTDNEQTSSQTRV